MSHWTDGGGQHPDGRFPDSVESASSTLVSTIEEIRNNQSISNLYMAMDGDNLGINTNCVAGTPTYDKPSSTVEQFIQ